MTDKRIVIFGATGTAGGGVARQFLQAGWKVLAATRDVSSPRARAVAAAGAEVVLADLDVRHSIHRILEGVGTVYFSGPSLLNRWDIGEAAQGINVVDAAAEVGVEHLIYQSALVGNGRGILSFGSKRAIEERIAELDVPYTINRPGLFMENLLNYFPVEKGGAGWTVSAALPLDKCQGWIAAQDIGRAAVAVAENPQRHRGLTHELVAENVSFGDVIRLIREESGLDVRPVSLPIEALQDTWPQGVRMFRWMQERTEIDDPTGLRNLIGEPTQLRSWIREYILPLLAASS